MSVGVVYQIPYEDVIEAVERLPPRERFVIEERADGKTLKEIGEILGVCACRIRCIQLRASRRIRNLWRYNKNHY